jgi:hypothetical protein
VALRPNLSEGLPFSKRIYYLSFLLIGMLIENFRSFLSFHAGKGKGVKSFFDISYGFSYLVNHIQTSAH